ncbi:MAG: isoprenylcysteine carboxylmethyltransferase family protein [Candidatus Levybacteria bacterium]|nr:isoprenylcysteine carboxylmethyltransferase family protein [Candidatus Levybacteria bacterium]
MELSIQVIGFCISLIGILIAVAGRKELGANWTHAREYQVKRRHELVETGIYRYIRHPIYTGFAVYLIGAELVAKSWLVIPIVLIAFSGAYIQGKREEKLLLAHFGKQYKQYMRRSKMLIPFV